MEIEKDDKMLKVDPKVYDLINNAVQAGVSKGVKDALIEYDKRIKNKNKINYDKRIRNTWLLLENYRNFINHYENAIYEISEDIKSLNEEEETVKLFDKIYDISNDKTIINSILKSKERTAIILKHMNRCIDYYKYQAANSNNIEFQRRVKVIEMSFLNKNKMSNVPISDELHISLKTVSRDKKRAVTELAPLFFRN